MIFTQVGTHFPLGNLALWFRLLIKRYNERILITHFLTQLFSIKAELPINQTGLITTIFVSETGCARTYVCVCAYICMSVSRVCLAPTEVRRGSGGPSGMRGSAACTWYFHMELGTTLCPLQGHVPSCRHLSLPTPLTSLLHFQSRGRRSSVSSTSLVYKASSTEKLWLEKPKKKKAFFFQSL